jgi:hypothetical protein
MKFDRLVVPKILLELFVASIDLLFLNSLYCLVRITCARSGLHPTISVPTLLIKKGIERYL